MADRLVGFSAERRPAKGAGGVDEEPELHGPEERGLVEFGERVGPDEFGVFDDEVPYWAVDEVNQRPEEVALANGSRGCEPDGPDRVEEVLAEGCEVLGDRHRAWT
ncbi:hypothetical protein NOMA109596_01010 [Nocardioides marinus]